MKRDLDSGFKKPGKQALRKSARVNIAAQVKLCRTGDQHYQVQAFDLSREGCKLEFVEPPRLDESIWLKFDQLEALEAIVCWTEGLCAGVEFTRPMHVAVFEHLLARLR